MPQPWSSTLAAMAPAVAGDGLPTTSVVICTRSERRWSELQAAVRSARIQEPPPVEVIVVVDHNRDLQARAEEHLPVDVAVVANSGVPGLSGARNTGLLSAGGELVAFLDDDAYAHPGWLRALIEPFSDRDVIASGGIALPRWPDRPPRWLPPELYWVVGCSYRGMPTAPGAVRSPLGANMAFRRRVLDLVGGFSDEIGRAVRPALSCAEAEVSLRARARTGGTILHVPGSRVDHRVAGERLSWRHFRRRCFDVGVSEALIMRGVGSDPGWASESSYVLHTLPGGLRRGMRAALRGDLSGLAVPRRSSPA